MSKWKECTIESLGKIITGKTPRTSIVGNYGGTIPFLSPSDNMEVKYVVKTGKTLTNVGVNEVKNCLLPKNAVCVSCIGSDLGKVLITTEPTVTNQQINSIIVNSDNDTDFVYYLMKIVGKQLNYISKTSTAVPIINKTTFSTHKILVPSLDEQKKIASILSSLDDKIETNRHISATLEDLAKTIFKSWFIDFEPFKDGKFVDSELGMIPEGWKVVTLSEYVDNFGGYSYKGNELQPSTTAMATIKNFVRGGGFKTDGYKEIVISKNIKDYQYVKLFDVLVAHTDLTQNAEVVGNPAIVLSTAGYEKLIMSMDLTKVVPKDSRLTSPLVHQILSTPKFKEHALGYVNGTTVLHMNKKAVPDYKLAMPSDINVLKDLASVLDDLYRLMSEKYAENIALATLRDTLLPKLMSGQITL
jgi:type I restriction enzyme S subunit